MKIIMPKYGYEFLVEKNGVNAVNKNVTTESDKLLYQSILKLLNVDFTNAPVKFQDQDIIQQKIEYIINANKSLRLQLVGKIDIKKNTEKLDFIDTVVFSAEDQKSI